MSQTFDAFGLHPQIVEAVARLGFDTPTPVQAAAIGPLMDGADVIGGARTGSGKTAAFGLPLVHKVAEHPGNEGAPVRAIVLTPTRELALQVTEALRSFARGLPVRIATIYGGAPYPPQLKALRSGVQVVVGTPGRVIDHLDRGTLDLSHVEMLVLDEADEMLRMGFLDDVERILSSANPGRQTALFSATMPDPIRRIAKTFLREPVQIDVEDEALTVDHIAQTWIKVPQREKLDALVRVLRANRDARGALVFSRTRQGCAEVADALAGRGLAVDALHGDLNQSARERVLGRFRAQVLGVVIATDVAARGLDVDHVDLVVNLDLPDEAETYVHRIGRTGRAGREGKAVTFVAPSQRTRLRFLEKALGVRIAEAGVPSDRELTQGDRRGLLDALRDAEGTEHALAWLKEVAAEVPLETVAAAAVALLAAQRGVDLGPLPPEPPRFVERPPERGADRRGDRPAPEGVERAGGPRVEDPGDPPDGPVVEVFLAAGERQGVRVGDIVGALVRQGGVPAGWIGRVTVALRKSFVALPEVVAEELVDRMPVMELRGRAVRLSMARGR